MDMANHPLITHLKLAKAKAPKPIDMVRTTVSQSMKIQVVTQPTTHTLVNVVSGANARYPILFDYLEPISGKVCTTSISTKGAKNTLLYAPFIKRLFKTFIGTDLTLSPKGFEGWGNIMSETLGHIRTGETYGDYCMSQDDINGIINSYIKTNIVKNEDGGYSRLTHMLYLPVSSSDLNLHLEGFNSLTPVLQATIRVALDISKFKTYIRVLLMDGFEFVLWYSPEGLITMSEY